MKKIIAILALLPLLLVVGCNQNQTSNPSTNPPTNAPSSAPGYTNAPPMANTNTPAGTNGQ
ncbi:MAG: hypothetical protein ACREFE_00460 [Limisphaerales bacterium]